MDLLSPVKALDLFDAYHQNKLPRENGYIIVLFSNPEYTYIKFEIIGYKYLDSIYLSEKGLTFKTDGKKIYIIIEPAKYPMKLIEPFRRLSNNYIPHRFRELKIITAGNQTKIMISNYPILIYAAFSVMKPVGNNYSYIFYNQDDILNTMTVFFEKTLHKEAYVPLEDAIQGTKIIIQKIKSFTSNQ